MARPSNKDRLNAWGKRISSARKEREEWSTEFDCATLENFYYGHQHSEEPAEWDKRKYVINRFFPSIEISKPSMLFSTPKYKVEPRLTRIDDAYSDVEARAKLQEETLNHFVGSPQLGYGIETGLALLDAMFRIGVIQVGYTADFIDNPTAGKPMLNDRQEAMRGEDGEAVAQPQVSMTGETLFLKWIPGETWLVNENAPNRLEGADWCVYHEWHRIEDIKSNKNYKNTSKLRATGKSKLDASDENEPKEEKERRGMLKVYFIWDNRAKKRFLFALGQDEFFLEKEFAYLPFPRPLKFNERLGKFWPMPPTYNWMHPQRELNETREIQRIHRRRAIRRYGRRPSVEQEEFDKLTTGEDMVCIVLQNPETDIAPIPDAPLDPAVARNIAQTDDDFTRVSLISGEAQQVAQSETATQANLIALNSRVRDAAKRMDVAGWLGDLGRVILLCLRENMALPFWIRIAVDPHSPLAMLEAQEAAKLWQQITAEALGPIDNDVTVEMSSLSPAATEQERTEWLTFLNLVLSPQVGAVLAQSPMLLRKTAGLFNIHSERDLSEISKAMMAAAFMFAKAQAQAAAPKPKGGGAAPGPTPSNGQIGGQLAQQLPI